jgi:hypothetical protein
MFLLFKDERGRSFGKNRPVSSRVKGAAYGISAVHSGQTAERMKAHKRLFTQLFHAARKNDIRPV